jgi:hypothetical protein
VFHELSKKIESKLREEKKNLEPPLTKEKEVS